MGEYHQNNSGVLTPPLSEDGNSGCHVGSKPAFAADEVNNRLSSPAATSDSLLPPAPPAKSRRDRSSSQREANRSKQFTDRVQRTATEGSSSDLPARRARKFHRQTTSLPAQALKAVEPPHEQLLTKMAFAEQQKWITEQQKTFTKW